MPTEAAMEAARILRDGSLFQWYVITLFALVVYVYSVEIERRNWSLVFAGLAFWGMDWFNEIWNALVFHFTNYAPEGIGAPAVRQHLQDLAAFVRLVSPTAQVQISKVLPALQD